MPTPDEYEDFEAIPEAEVVEDEPVVEYPADSQPPEEVAAESDLIKIVPERTDEQLSVDAFVAKVMAERNEPEKVFVPPPMTERQMSARDTEMAAGAARVQHFEAQKQIARPHVPDPSEGRSTPVFVPKTVAGKDAKFGPGGTPIK